MVVEYKKHCVIGVEGSRGVTIGYAWEDNLKASNNAYDGRTRSAEGCHVHAGTRYLCRNGPKPTCSVGGVDCL